MTIPRMFRSILVISTLSLVLIATLAVFAPGAVRANYETEPRAWHSFLSR